MTEENEGKEKNGTAENTGEGDKPTQTELNKQTNEASERLEKANEDAERINAETRQRIALGGTSDAGGEKTTPKEETPKEYNDRIEKETSEGKHGE